jgi:carbon-monoxide dehydrogenase large subunit
VPFKVIGTGGSLASTLATGSVLEACRQVREQVARVAAHLLECDPADIDVVDGRVMARGAPSSAMTLAQVAEVTLMSPIRIPADMEPALEATATYGWPGPRWTVGTHGCIVEVDAATGHVDIQRYVAAVDCGSTINPAIVEGQVRGGIAQGIGGVLYEDIGYGDDGQPRATTFMDYLLPTASEVPPIDVRLLPRVDDQFQPLGIGESGAVLSPATLTNAIADALRPLGVAIAEQHLPPARLLELIEQAGVRS